METLHQNRSLVLFEGIALIILGLLAIGLPVLFTFGVEQFLGWLFLFSGIIQVFRAIKTRQSEGFWASLAAGILAIVVGGLLLANPTTGVFSLTILLTISFFLEGVIKTALAFSLRDFPNWGWMLVSGLLAFAMAAIIYAGWPGTAMWVLGLLVGINLLFYGYSLLILYAQLGKGNFPKA